MAAADFKSAVADPEPAAAAPGVVQLRGSAVPEALASLRRPARQRPEARRPRLLLPAGTHRAGGGVHEPGRRKPDAPLRSALQAALPRAQHAVELKAETETDEVYAQIMLMPELEQSEVAVEKASSASAAAPRPPVRSFC